MSPGKPSLAPYLLRAFCDYCAAADVAPFLETSMSESVAACLPESMRGEEKIVFNLSPQAVSELIISNEEASFLARFGGQIRRLTVPMGDVVAVYESGGGGVSLQNLSPPAPEPDDRRPKLEVL